MRAVPAILAVLLVATTARADDARSVLESIDRERVSAGDAALREASVQVRSASAPGVACALGLRKPDRRAFRIEGGSAMEWAMSTGASAVHLLDAAFPARAVSLLSTWDFEVIEGEDLVRLEGRRRDGAANETLTLWIDDQGRLARALSRTLIEDDPVLEGDYWTERDYAYRHADRDGRTLFLGWVARCSGMGSAWTETLLLEYAERDGVLVPVKATAGMDGGTCELEFFDFAVDDRARPTAFE